jgi:hypothetical protein
MFTGGRRGDTAGARTGPAGRPGGVVGPDVHARDEIHPGVVVTGNETATCFEYDVREPLPGHDVDVLEDDLIGI